jgi:hypothetical protein
MRINGATAPGLGAATQTVRRGPSGTFSLPEETPARSRGVGTTQTVSGIDALLALQGIEDPTERRRRAVARGRQVLDVLEEIRLGLLSGTADRSALGRLKGVVAELKQVTGDPALDQVLAEIELRAEVELAKAGL